MSGFITKIRILTIASGFFLKYIDYNALHKLYEMLHYFNKTKRSKLKKKLEITEFLCYDFLCVTERGDFMSQQDWFHEMYKCYAADLLRYVRHLLQDVSELRSCAEDYMQMAFMQLYSNQQALMEHENIEAWLKRVVRNQIADDVRKLQMRYEKLGAPIDMEEFAQQEARYRWNLDDAMWEGGMLEMRDLFKRGLSDAEYPLFSMLYLLKWPRDRIAQALNVSPSALKKRISRLQKKMWQIWQENSC